jgi:rhodanese-related sulfurtransferase
MPMPEFKQLVDMIKGEGVAEISPEELRQMKNRGEDFSLIDVREPDDWKSGIIPDAQTLSRGVLELKIDQITTDKDRKIVLYCNGGACSALAAHMLQRMGFRNVHSLAGGYNGWVSSQRR